MGASSVENKLEIDDKASNPVVNLALGTVKISKRQRLKLEKREMILAAIAESVGKNGGLVSSTTLDEVLAAVEEDDPHLKVDPGYLIGFLYRFLYEERKKSGLTTTGEIFYKAVTEGKAELHISAPKPSKPSLIPLENLVLESMAKVLVPKGGYFKGYRDAAHQLLQQTRERIDYYAQKLVERFGLSNIEQVIIAAFAAGILDPERLFGKDIPATLKVIMSSDSYREAAEQTSAMPRQRATVLTNREREYIEIYALAMGKNGGLYALDLLKQSDLLKLEIFRNRPNPLHNLMSTVKDAGARYGLQNPSIGEVVYEARKRGDIDEMPISLPSSIRPKLTELEVIILEELAKTLIPRGGFFLSYRLQAQNPVGSINALKAASSSINHKFNSDNIEQSIVMAIATGLLNPHELFSSELPFPLKIIMASEAYKRVAKTQATGLFARTLTDKEMDIAMNLIERIGLNGGLFWAHMLEATAKSLEKKYSHVQSTVSVMHNKFGIAHTGSMLYAAAALLGTPITVSLPPKIDANIDDFELSLMSEFARFLLPVGGYYSGFLKAASEHVHYEIGYVNIVTGRVVKKTGTANRGQAVTYLIGHGLIPIPSLRLDPSKTPALDAIIAAMAKNNLSSHAYVTLNPPMQRG